MAFGFGGGGTLILPSFGAHSRRKVNCGSKTEDKGEESGGGIGTGVGVLVDRADGNGPAGVVGFLLNSLDAAIGWEVLKLFLLKGFSAFGVGESAFSLVGSGENIALGGIGATEAHKPTVRKAALSEGGNRMGCRIGKAGSDKHSTN